MSPIFLASTRGLGQVLVHTYVRPHHNLGPDPHDLKLSRVSHRKLVEKPSDEPYVLGYALGTEANETNETGPLQMSYAGGPKHGYLAISCLRGFPISIEEGAEALSSIASRPGLFQAMI